MRRMTSGDGCGLVTLVAALGGVASPLLAADTPPPGADAQSPGLGALLAAGAGFLGLVILFIMIVVHKRSRKHQVVEREAAEPEPESPEPEAPEESGPDEDESASG